MNNTNLQGRNLTVKNEFKLSRFLVKWEMFLIYILVLINIVLMIMRPNLYFASGTVSSIIQSGMDLSFMVLGMVFILMLGDIDVSIASIMILSGMVIGILYDAGVNMVAAVLLGIIAGGLCGLFNGILVAKIKMPAVIVTIATSLLFRGIVKIILDVNVLKNFPKWFSSLAWNNVFGIPISLICFLAVAAIFSVILHRSKFGRQLYMVGNSKVVSEYSGIRVEKIKIMVFVIMGVMAGIASIFFVGRMGGGLSSTMAKGYELDVIAIAVLGGVSSNGGKGKVYGPVIATLVMAFLIYTMGLLEVDANSRKILTGIILIVAVFIPNINKELIANIRLRFMYSDNKNIEAINIRCINEVNGIKHKISELKKDSTLTAEEKEAKIKAYQAKIESTIKKCQQATKALKAENIKAKKRFAK